jgi:phosphatidylinositol glycan class B
MIAGGLLWLIFIQRLSIAKIFAVLVGLGMVIGVGVLIDHWFYGQWLFTPWNYFRTDVLFADAVRFGTSPWYYYASELYQADAKSAIKLIVLLGAIHYIYYHRRGIITFVVIPFVLIHLFIGHKEMRFMIPVAFFAPYFTVVFWQYFTQRIHSEWSGHIQRLIVFQALFINMISLAVTAFKPADGQPLVYEYLYDRYKSTAYNIYYIEKGGNFFWSQGLLPMNFYNPSKNKISPIDRDAIMSLSASGQPCDNIVIADRRQDLSDLPLKAVYTHKPDWLLTLDLNDWMKIKNDDWIVYQVIAKYPSKKT